MSSSENLLKVSALIKNDLTLERVRDLKATLLKEKSTLEYQLSKESDQYYGLVEDSLKLMSLSQDSVKIIREKLQNVNDLSKENNSSISRYQVIFDSTKLYEVIDMTSSIYNKIITFNKFASSIDQLLDNALEDDNFSSGSPYLLEIHYSLTKIRDFQDQMTILANVSNNDVMRTVQKLFGVTSSLTEKFDELLKSLIYDIVEFVREEQLSLVIRLMKIIDIEEREDLNIIAIKNIIKKKEIETHLSSNKKLPNNKMLDKIESRQDESKYPTNSGLYNEIMNGSITTRTNPRNYKTFFLDTITNSIQDMFVEVRKEYQGERRFEVLENLDWVFNELLVIKEHVSKCCPTYWNLFDIYYNLYFDEVHLLIKELVESEPETLIILDILDFDKTFQKTLIKDFGFEKSQVKTVIGDNEKEKLFADYLALLLTKMKEWLGNLIKAEFTVFVERATPPHSDSEGLLFLDGTKTCFQMFTQQVEVAAGSSQAKILVGVVENFCGLLQDRQKDWIDMIEKEVIKLMNFNHMYDLDPQAIPPEERCPGGLVEYLTAVANDQMRAADYAVALSTKYGQFVSKVHERAITNHIESTLDGFAEVAKCSSTGLLTIMFDDLKKPYEEIFSKAWYGGSQAQQISDTLGEYLTEIQEVMNPFVFSTLIESVVEECILNFIQALKYEHSFKSKNNKFLECMKRDFEIFYKLFIRFVSEGEDKAIIIDDKFKLMEYFMDFSCGSQEDIMETWNKCISVYWDTPIVFLEAILRCRKDIDNSKSKGIFQKALAMSKGPERMNNIINSELQPTFISRLNFK